VQVIEEGESGKREGNGRVGNAGLMSGFYKLQLHPSHFPHSWEVGGPYGTRGASVFNDYRQLMRRSFRINLWFPFLKPRKGRLHSCQTQLFMQPSDTTSGGLVTSTFMW